MSEKFTLMHAEKATFTIELMARLLSVSRAGSTRGRSGGTRSRRFAHA